MLFRSDPAALRTREAFQAAEELGLTNKSVFFITDRIPYRDIGGFYLDANAAVSTYPDTLETRFCLGSRILDFVWAGLPMVVSGCDLQRECVEGQGLGIVVRPGDARALADAIRRLRDRIAQESFKPAFEAAREKLKWPVATRAIAAYCTSPAARTRRGRKSMWSARLEVAEFLVRSLVIRAAVRLHSGGGE